MKMKWKFLLDRKNLTLVFYELVTRYQTEKGMKEIMGVDFGFDNYRAVQGAVYYGAEDVKKANKKVKQIYLKKGAGFFKSLIEQWNDFFDELLKLSVVISKIDYSDKSNDELVDDLRKLRDAYYKTSTALYSPILIEALADDIMRKYLQERTDKVIDFFNILTTPVIESDATKELKSILKIAIKKNDISNDIKKHIKEFGWINARGFGGDGWSEKEVLERLDYILKEDPKEKLDKLEKHAKGVVEETEKVLSVINADQKFREFVEITKDFVFFRNYRMDMYTKAGFVARNLFREIAKRLGIDLCDLFYLLTDEIVDALNSDEDYLDKIKERKKGYVYILQKEKITILVGRELEEYKKKEIKDEVEQVDEVKGTIACKGKVTGIVKLVPGKKDIGKVEKGDVLVTSMTTPDFVPAMEKAAAFVTDEGGICCHAAIVSREMEKPCVIGTKIATRVFKDGDKVEVDAETGVVRKIYK